MVFNAVECLNTQQDLEVRMNEKLEMITNTINTISLDTEGKCNTCGFWSSHSNDFPKHKTCLCRLVAERGICCLEGYKTLINDVPNLGFVVPFPLAFNKEMKAAI